MNTSKDIFFHKGIDSDTDARFLAEGYYRLSTYMRGGQVGQESAGGLETALGNTIVSNDLPTGTNIFVGGCGWTERNLIVFAIYNSDTNHGWWYYDVLNGTFQLIFQSSELNFRPQSRIVNPFIIDGVLYWTDGFFNSYINNDFNPPRRLNIDNAIAGDYSEDVFQVLDVIKWPPIFAPLTAYGTNDGQPNLIKNNLYRFRYRYIYEDQQYSCWSPISEVALPTNGYYQDGTLGAVEDVTGGQTFNTSTDNFIGVTINTGTIHVKKIEVAYQIGNFGQFNVFKTLDKEQDAIPSNDVFTVNYTGQEAGFPINLNIPNFDLVPQIAKAQELIATDSSPLISYANFVEDFDQVEMDCEVDYFPRLLTEVVEGVKGIMPIVKFENFPTYTEFDLSFSGENPFVLGDIVVFQLKDGSGIIYNYLYVVDTIASTTATILAAAAFLSAQGLTVSVVSGKIRIDGMEATFPTDGDVGTTECYRTIKPVPSFKLNSIYEVGLKYEDRANREGTTQFVETQMTVEIPDALTVYNEGGYTDLNQPFFTNLRLRVNHIPPAFATHVRVMLRPHTPSFGYYALRLCESIEDYPTRVKISLESWYSLTNNVQLKHQIAAGDQLIFVRNEPTFDAANNYLADYTETQFARFLTVHEYLPAGGIDGNDAIIVDRFPFFGVESDIETVFRGALMEIRTPRKTGENDPWFEACEGSVIVDANTNNRYHGGSTVELNVTANTTNTFTVVGNFTDAQGYRILLFNGGVGFYLPITSAVFNGTTNRTVITITGTIGTFDSAFVVYAQSSTMFATYRIDCGDVYVRPRWRKSGFANAAASTNRWKNYMYTYEEDVQYSDFYVSDTNSLGRIGKSDIDAKRREQKSVVCHSKVLVDASNVNRLNVFEFPDRMYLSEEKGEINRIILSGYTLTCLQERKNTSIYIQKSMYVQGDGSLGFQSEDKVFASMRSREEDWGTTFAESVILSDGNIHYYDGFNKQWVLSNNSGQVALSKIRKANTLVNGLSTAALLRVSAYENYLNNEVVMAFIYEDYAVHLSYSKTDELYKTLYLDYVDGFVTFASYLVGFLEGQLYTYNTNQNCEFFGVTHEPTLTFVANNDPTLIKRFMRLGLKTDGLYELSSVKIPANQTYGEMESSIPSTNFQVLEGYSFANYKNDQNSPNFATPTEARINGRPLRGTYATHIITQKSSGKSIIFAANVLTVNSPAKI